MTMSVTETIELLEDLNLPDAELSSLVESLTKDGLTETNRRQVHVVLMREAGKLDKDVRAYEEALDILTERDKKIADIKKTTEQAIGRTNMQIKSKLEALGRDAKEDTEAEQAGATLLLHTDDVIADSENPSVLAPVAAPSMSPKEAMNAVTAAAEPKNSNQGISPIATPMNPTPSFPVDDSSSPTLAPLPPTPMAPLAVTEPGA